VLYIIGCGVKSDPVLPKGSGIPSYVNKFVGVAESEDDEQSSSEKTENIKRDD
jgi:hypothetical protein